jgi:hypothetical protein
MSPGALLLKSAYWNEKGLGELLRQTRTNLSGRFDASAATVLMGNTDTIILRITYK